MTGNQRLDSVTEITMGQAPDGKSYNFDGSGLPLIAGAGDFGDPHPAAKKFTSSPGKVCRAGDIVLGIRASIGEKVIADREYCLGRGVAGLRPKSQLSDRYLWHWLACAAPSLAAKAKGATFKQVNRQDIGELRIALPALTEQRRIAAILDKADALRAKRRAALAQLDTLTQSIFLDMFGDPLANPKAWPRVEFSELLANIDSGWSPNCLDRPVTGEEWGVLKLGAVTWCEYNEAQNKALPADIEPDPSIEVKPGDLLFARKNTHELVAACALVRETRPRLLMSDLIFRLRLRPRAAVDSRFLHQLLIYPTKRKDIQKLAGGSAGSMPNISKARLGSISIEVPPVELQLEFASRVAAVERQKSAQRASMLMLGSVFGSLQHRAFRGEL